MLPTKTGTDAGQEMVEMTRGMGDAGAASVQPVSTRERPRILNDQVANVVEVDWMRSDGRLRMLQDPSERSAIIWVKRRSQTPQGRLIRRAPIMLEQNTPLGIEVSQK